MSVVSRPVFKHPKEVDEDVAEGIRGLFSVTEQTRKFAMSSLLEHVISKGFKHEESAALQVVCSAVSSFKHGKKEDSLPSGTAAAWLPKPHNKCIVPAIADCISQSATRTSVERAVRFLAARSARRKASWRT